jgi:hypothetical protein
MWEGLPRCNFSFACYYLWGYGYPDPILYL